MTRTNPPATLSAGLGAAAVVLWLGSGVCRAQETATPERRPDARLNPALTDVSADANMRDRLSRPLGGVPVTPSSSPIVQQVVPDLPVNPSRLALADGQTAWIAPGTLRPEGTFLVGWTGEIVRLRTGGLAFLPAAATGATVPEPAMALLPCGTYSRLESLLGDETGGLWLSLTGEMMVYQGRNWLLPTLFAAADAPPPPITDAADRQAPPPDTQPEAAPDQPEMPSTGDRVEDLIRQLEAQREERRGIDTTFTPPKDQTTDEEDATPGPRLDGRMLLSQRGRMVRSPEGGWVIAIDNDGGTATSLPNHLRLLPCKLVEEMERKAENDGESWSFEISGDLHRYGESVYLLPRMYVSQPGDDVRALQ